MDFSIIFENINFYLKGLLLTLELVSLSLVLGFVIALVLALLLVRLKNSIWLYPIKAYIYFFRGTPLLVQIFLIYYGLSQFEWIRDSFAWAYLSEAFPCALLALTLNTAAYGCEIIRVAIQTTEIAEEEAAKAFGMSTFQLYRKIILPSTFRRMIPSYSNEVIFMLHGSAVVSTITLVDLTGVARIINSKYFSPYEAYITSGLIYLIITLLITNVSKLLERHYLKHLKT